MLFPPQRFPISSPSPFLPSIFFPISSSHDIASIHTNVVSQTSLCATHSVPRTTRHAPPATDHPRCGPDLNMPLTPTYGLATDLNTPPIPTSSSATNIALPLPRARSRRCPTSALDASHTPVHLSRTALGVGQPPMWSSPPPVGFWPSSPPGAGFCPLSPPRGRSYTTPTPQPGLRQWMSPMLWGHPPGGINLEGN
jgi:hypothetical protein